MRTISVSTEVFAKIWFLRRPGENSEDVVLHRVLGCDEELGNAGEPRPQAPVSGRDPIGVFDRRHGVHFPDGFEVFRVYRGRDYKACATSGNWIRSDGVSCRTLNELSRSIGARTENAWVNWFFKDKDGLRVAVASLRKEIADNEGPESDEPRQPGGIQDSSDPTWRGDVRRALEELGGRASLNSLYKQTKKIRRAHARSIPEAVEAVVRRTLEENSSDSEVYRGGPDLFWMPEGKGAGVWALRPRA